MRSIGLCEWINNFHPIFFNGCNYLSILWLKLIMIIYVKNTMTSSNGNIFQVTGLLCGEFTGHRCIPLKRPVIFSLIGDCTNGWANNPDAGDWRRHCFHYDVSVIKCGGCCNIRNLSLTQILENSNFSVVTRWSWDFVESTAVKLSCYVRNL